MSDIKFNCPSCGQSLEAPPGMAGQLIDCPSCKKTIEVYAYRTTPGVEIPHPPLASSPRPSPKIHRTQPPSPPSAKVLPKKLVFLLVPPLVTLVIGILVGYAVGKPSSQTSKHSASSAQHAPATPTSDDHVNRIANVLAADINNLGNNPITGQESVSIEQVVLFYDKYAGQKLVFQGCSVDHDVEKRSDGWFVLRVTSRGGKYVPGIMPPRFVMGPPMVEQMAPHLSGGYNWSNCILQCRLLNDGIIFVIGMDVYNAGGNIGKSFRNK